MIPSVSCRRRQSPGWACKPARSARWHAYAEARRSGTVEQAKDPVRAVRIRRQASVVRDARWVTNAHWPRWRPCWICHCRTAAGRTARDAEATVHSPAGAGSADKLRAVDEVAAILDRAPRELVERCGFDRAVLFRVHGRMVMEVGVLRRGRRGSREDGGVRPVGSATTGPYAVGNPDDSAAGAGDRARCPNDPGSTVPSSTSPDPVLRRRAGDADRRVIGFPHADRLADGRWIQESTHGVGVRRGLQVRLRADRPARTDAPPTEVRTAR